MTIDITKPLELSDDLTEGRTMRTSEECLQRMEALCRKMATDCTAHSIPKQYDEARAIVAELDMSKPSEETLIARELLLEMHHWFSDAADDTYSAITANIKDGGWDNVKPMRFVLDAFAKVRHAK